MIPELRIVINFSVALLLIEKGRILNLQFLFEFLLYIIVSCILFIIHVSVVCISAYQKDRRYLIYTNILYAREIEMHIFILAHK